MPLAATLVGAAVLASCAGSTDVLERPGVLVPGDKLTVYSSAALSGDQRQSGEALVNGERLALADAGGRAGKFTVGLAVLNSVQGRMRLWSEGQVASNARTAVQDPLSIAYIGDSDSASTAITLPLLNQAGTLQITPLASYSALTSPEHGAAGEPQRFYPSGARTLGRLAPGSIGEAAALARLQRQQGCSSSFLIAGDSPQGRNFEALVAEQIRAAGIRLAGTTAVGGGQPSVGAVAGQLARSKADCFFYGAAADLDAARLINAAIAARGSLKAFGGRGLTDEQFTQNLSARAQQATLITTPGPDPDRLSARGKEFVKRYRAQFGSDPGSAGLYGYEAMAVVIDALRRAGPNANNRATVVDSFRAIKGRDSVLGRYSVRPTGDTTLNQFLVSRVVAGGLVVSPSLTDAIAR